MADSITIVPADLHGSPFVGVDLTVTWVGGPYTTFQGFRRTPGGAARTCGDPVPVVGASPQVVRLASAGQSDHPGNHFWSVRGEAVTTPAVGISISDSGSGLAHADSLVPHGLYVGAPIVVSQAYPYDGPWVVTQVLSANAFIFPAAYVNAATGFVNLATATAPLDSPEVFACASPLHYSLHSRVIDSIQRRLVAMNLPGIGEHVFTKKGFEVNAAKRYPAIVLSLDDEQERDMGGTVLCDDWGYPVKAQIVDQKHDAPVLDENYLYWRERIRSLHPLRLDDVPGSMKTLFEPRWLIQYRQDQLLYYTSLAILRCVVRAGRT